MDLKQAKHSEIIGRIKERQKTLKWAGKELKKHFVGLDKIIDKIVKDIEAWYVMPELLTRPVIICLWGPTGVGKTDLVRRLVSLLEFHDRYCEIEMMNKGGGEYGWHNTMSAILSSNPKIESGMPSVFLLDEIQNFRTIDENGHEMSDYKFRDVWTLLSDGKLPFEVDVDYLLQMLWEYGDKSMKPPKKKQGLTDKFLKSVEDDSDSADTFDEDMLSDLGDYDIPMDLEDDKGDPDMTSEAVLLPPDTSMPEEIDPDDEDSSYWNLKRFKTALRIDESLQEIATWDNAKKRKIIMDKLNDERLYQQVDYTKCLIFISGNLDEAYQFASKTDEVDVDADIFHDLSLKINILDIKSSLRARFKPEQIARFGNMQVIYPSLSKLSYETIIERKIREITDNIRWRFGIKVTIDDSIKELIYNNGVFPTQGTRPVFSTISEVLESSMSIFLLRAFMENAKAVTLKYKKNRVVATINKKTVGFTYKGVVDKLKLDRNKNMDRRVLCAAHEAGHAVTYAAMLKISPPQMTAQPAAQDVGGFICLHQNCGAKYLLEQKISIMLAGSVAEKMVFGEDSHTYGSKDDLLEATRLAGQMIKRYGMSDFASFMMKPNEQTDLYRTDVENADILIEKIISNCTKVAEDILIDNMDLFKQTIDALLTNKKVTPKVFKQICADNGLKIQIKNSEDVICDAYMKKYKAFRKKTS